MRKTGQTVLLKGNFITLLESGCFRQVFLHTNNLFDSRLKGRGFEPHLRHCIVVLEQDTFILA